MKPLFAIALIVAASLAGCAGAPSQDLQFRHEESSEQSRITIEKAPRDVLSYNRFFVVVDGKSYAFGGLASWSDRRYMVEGKQDAVSRVEAGDVITVPAAGKVNIELKKDDQVLGAFEANVPDNKAPAAPMLREPQNGAQGVSRTPSFRWDAVSDPSGLTYTLTYSLDPQFAIPVLTGKAEQLPATQYTVGGGKELLSGQKYYWHVQAVDGAGNASPWSQTYEFIVAG